MTDPSSVHIKHLDILMPFLNARAAFVPSPAELRYPMTSQDDEETTETTEASVVPPPEFTKDVFAILLDGAPVGYRRSYKSAMRAVERIKRDISLKQGWDVWLQWSEWKPRHDEMQHFVLESRPYNNLMTYTKKIHEVTVHRLKYFE